MTPHLQDQTASPQGAAGHKFLYLLVMTGGRLTRKQFITPDCMVRIISSASAAIRTSVHALSHKHTANCDEYSSTRTSSSTTNYRPPRQGTV
mmetsp:Transcript_28812/g.44793  ORF Transcript_28812/g.44793 Transcript_28812/m.44793 type:complete len:92 (+) Transcript_28812:760-1035(+)